MLALPGSSHRWMAGGAAEPAAAAGLPPAKGMTGMLVTILRSGTAWLWKAVMSPSKSEEVAVNRLFVESSILWSESRAGLAVGRQRQSWGREQEAVHNSEEGQSQGSSAVKHKTPTHTHLPNPWSVPDGPEGRRVVHGVQVGGASSVRWGFLLLLSRCRR